MTSEQSKDPVISAAMLAGLLDRNEVHVVLVDCRHRLDDLNYGRRAFEEGHIPGAHFAHLDDDLSGEIQPGITGRHPLPEPDEFAGLLRDFGVNPDTVVVCYDDKSGAIAARCWWMCRWIGHDASFVLDGGIQAWMANGGALSSDVPALATGSITPHVTGGRVIDADSILARLESGEVTLIDARAGERYRGEREPIDPVAGHIPGAVSLPFAGNLDDDGHLLDRARLRDRFAASYVDGKTPVVYCGSGVTAAHDILAMERAGLPTPLLYAGSWSDWITDSARPVATGP